MHPTVELLHKDIVIGIFVELLDFESISSFACVDKRFYNWCNQCIPWKEIVLQKIRAYSTHDLFIEIIETYKPKYDQYFTNKSLQPSFWKLIYNRFDSIPVPVSSEFDTVASSKHTTININVCGHAQVGKSAIIHQFLQRKFCCNKVSEFSKKYLYGGLNGTIMTLNIRYGNPAPADGYLLLYSASSAESFNILVTYVLDIDSLNASAPIVIVENKIDLDAVIPREHAQECFFLPFVSVSAKTGEGVDKAFHTLVKEIVEKRKN